MPEPAIAMEMRKALLSRSEPPYIPSGVSPPPLQPSWQERLMNWWQEGAGAPQNQAYNPRTYPPRPGVLPLGRRY